MFTILPDYDALASEFQASQKTIFIRANDAWPHPLQTRRNTEETPAAERVVETPGVLLCAIAVIGHMRTHGDEV
jgi:hypothetical protein